MYRLATAAPRNGSWCSSFLSSMEAVPWKCFEWEDFNGFQQEERTCQKSVFFLVKPGQRSVVRQPSVDKMQPELINSPLWCCQCLQGDHTAAQSTSETNWTQLIITWFKIHLHFFTVLVFVVVALGWEKVTYRNFEKSNSEGTFVSAGIEMTHDFATSDTSNLFIACWHGRRALRAFEDGNLPLVHDPAKAQPKGMRPMPPQTGKKFLLESTK